MTRVSERQGKLSVDCKLNVKIALTLCWKLKKTKENPKHSLSYNKEHSFLEVVKTVYTVVKKTDLNQMTFKQLP